MISFRRNFSSFGRPFLPSFLTLSQHLSRAYNNLPSPEHSTTVKETVPEDEAYVPIRGMEAAFPPSLHSSSCAVVWLRQDLSSFLLLLPSFVICCV